VETHASSDTPAGMHLENELKHHPETVGFINPVFENNVSIPEGYISLKEGFSEEREHARSLYQEKAKL
jgi:hypothetical protein